MGKCSGKIKIKTGIKISILSTSGHSTFVLSTIEVSWTLMEHLKMTPEE